MEKIMKQLYEKFLEFYRKYNFLDLKFWFGMEKIIKDYPRIFNSFFENYYKFSFVVFLKRMKDIFYSQNVFDFILKNSTDNWELWYYLKFLEKEKIIKLIKKEKILILKKELLKFFPPPQSELAIKKIIEKKLKIKIKENEQVTDIFRKFFRYKIKKNFDQLPISQASAIFLVKKILDYLPKKEKFLFVGDDDFISLLLGLVNPEISIFVVDIDEDLLGIIDHFAKKFKLKIQTKKIDVEKEKILGESFVGFLTNPIYTQEGVEKFVEWGLNQFGKDGGFVFIEIGDEAIGNRILFLQKFFSQKNLFIEEIIKGRIYYPYVKLHKEDKIIHIRFLRMFKKSLLKKSPYLAASLFIAHYVPFKVKRIKFKKPIYSYI